LRLTRAKGDGRGTQEASQIVLATDVHLLNASDLANTVWTCGKLQVKGTAVPRSFSDAVRRRALDILVEFAATDFAKTAWGFARLRDFHEAFFDALGHASCAVCGEATAQELSGLAWSFGKVVLLHVSLFKKVEQEFTERILEFQAQTLVNSI